MTAFEANPPLALYVHLPWCERKCPYCDFNSHAAGEIPESAYVKALLADLDEELTRVPERVLESVFIGGGTPSLFSVAAIGMLLEGIRTRAELAKDCEITLEANPGSAEAERFAGYRQAGVNRLSIGVQSFDDTSLRRIGRVHDARAAHRAVDMAHAAGFERINIDLMYGLPGQSLCEAIADVEQALKHEVSHLSHYELTIEPNTLFHRFPPERPDEDAVWAMHSECLARIEAAGLRRYEISAYAKGGAESRHNLNYWRFGDYIGVGAGAHGKLTDPARGVVERSSKPRHPRQYLAGDDGGEHTARRWVVPFSDLPLEFMLNAARLLEGFSETLFEARTGVALTAIDAPLARAAALGLLERGNGFIRPTARGTRFLNEYLLLFQTPLTGTAGGKEGMKRAPVDRGAEPPVL